MTYRILDVTPDTTEWYEARRRGFGASDSAALLGLSKWSTPLDVYRSKMGVERDFDPLLSWVGHKQETVIADWITDFHPEVGRLLPGFAAQSTEWPHLFATPDRVADDQGLLIPVELKTSMEFARDSWVHADTGKPNVPLYYQVQVQQQIAVLDSPYGWLAVFHGGRDFDLFRIPRDHEFITEQLVPITAKFWADHVEARIPPEPVSSKEAVELWPGDIDLSIEGGESLFELWGAYGLMQAELIEVEQTLDGMKLELQKAMRDATALTYQGQTLFTWRPRAGARRFDADRLQKDLPEVHAQYMTQSPPSRTFLRKKADT